LEFATSLYRTESLSVTRLVAKVAFSSKSSVYPAYTSAVIVERFATDQLRDDLTYFIADSARLVDYENVSEQERSDYVSSLRETIFYVIPVSGESSDGSIATQNVSIPATLVRKLYTGSADSNEIEEIRTLLDTAGVEGHRERHAARVELLNRQLRRHIDEPFNFEL
tara:strand:- start:898 stop:1398 length:501 start_codon:yes stop_codon:yes gene_type:complete